MREDQGKYKLFLKCQDSINNCIFLLRVSILSDQTQADAAGTELEQMDLEF